MATLERVPIHCRFCDGLLCPGDAHWTCDQCGHKYPMILGIIDMRQPELDRDSELQKAIVTALTAQFAGATFTELVDVYLTAAQVPDDLLNYFKNYFLNQEKRGRQFREMFMTRIEQQFGLHPTGAALELGCGAGAGLLALAKSFEVVIGLDPFLPSLILAQKLLAEHSQYNILLVCGHGQNLPFSDATFDYISAQNVLEHVFDARRIVSEIARVLKQHGGFGADSRNRFDLFFPEPHVKLRFVGFLPRQWAEPYVIRRSGKRYYDVFLLSYWDLRSIFQHAFGDNYRIGLPDVTVYGGPPWANSVLSRLGRIPILSILLLGTFPSHLVVAVKP